jgi:hypothetical protein
MQQLPSGLQFRVQSLSIVINQYLLHSRDRFPFQKKLRQTQDTPLPIKFTMFQPRHLHHQHATKLKNKLCSTGILTAKKRTRSLLGQQIGWASAGA